MRKTWSVIAASFLISLPVYALADITDYMGADGTPGKCPKVIVIRPDISQKNVFVPVDNSDLQSASTLIGTAVANKFTGSAVISSKDLNQYRTCADSQVILTKLKSYTTDSAIFGQKEGKATVGILRFKSPTADAPDKEVEVWAVGDRHWGDSIPFNNAIKAVCEKIQKTPL